MIAGVITKFVHSRSISIMQTALVYLEIIIAMSFRDVAIGGGK